MSTKRTGVDYTENRTYPWSNVTQAIKIEDNKGIIRRRESKDSQYNGQKKDRQYNDQKGQQYKQRSTKHYTENNN